MLNIGELIVQIGASTAGLEHAKSSIQRLANEITKLTAVQEDSAKKRSQMEYNLTKHMLALGKQKIAIEENAVKHAIAVGKQKLKQEETLELNSVKHAIAAGKQKIANEAAVVNQRRMELAKLAKEQEKLELNTVKHTVSAGKQKIASEQKAKKVAEAALLRQAELSLKAQQQADRLANSWRNIAGASKHIEQVNRALSVYQSRLNKGALSSNELKSSQLLFNQAIVDAKGKIGATGKVTTGFQSRMEDLTKSVQLALGPLSGVASRITAITALFNRSTLVWAGFFAIATAGILGFVKGVKGGLEVERFLAQINAQLRATGNAAGYSAEQLDAMAKTLAIDTLTSTKEARDAIAALTSYTSISGDTFKETLDVAMDMSTALGGSLVDSVKRLGKSLEDPGTVLEGLSDAGIRFTQTEKDMLQIMAKTNRMGEAQQYILDKLKARFEGAAPAAAKGLAGAIDTLGERWGHFFEALGSTEGVLPSITNAVNKLSDILAYLTNNITNAGKETKVLTGGMKVAADIIEGLLTNLDKIGAVVGLTVLYKGFSVILTKVGQLDGFFGAKGRLTTGIEKTRGALNRLLLLGASFGAGWAIGSWLRGFKVVRQVAYAFFGTVEKGVDHVIEFFELAGPRVQDAWGTIFNWLSDRYIDYIDTILKGAKVVDRLGIVPNKLINGLEAMKKGLNDNKVATEELDKQIEEIKKRHEENRRVIDDSVVALILEADAEGDVTEQVERHSGAIASNTKKVNVNATAILKMVDAMNDLIKEYVPGGEEVRKFNVDTEIMTRNTYAAADGLRQVAISLEDFIAAQTVGNKQPTAERIAMLTMEYNKLQKATAFAAQELERRNPATAMLNDTRDQLTAINKLTTKEKIFGFFDPSVTSDAIKLNAEVIKTTRQLEGLEAAGANLDDTRRALRALATEQGIEDLISDKDLSKIDELAKGIEEVKRAIERTATSFAAFNKAFSDIANGLGQMTSAQLSAMQELAAYHKQMALDALSYGRTQSEMYMQLADTVHYSNNAQAQSFEEKAYVAAEAAARQYQAEKEAQAKANILAAKAFESQKKIQMAQAIMATATAVMQTYTNSGLGIFAAPLAAAMAGIGAAQVNLISQQKFTPRERGGPMTGGKPYLVGEKGPELIIPGQGGTVMNNRDLMNNLGSGGGETRVDININALDTKDAAKVIYENRGMIINMFKQAQSEKLGAGI